MYLFCRTEYSFFLPEMLPESISVFRYPSDLTTSGRIFFSLYLCTL